MAHVIVAVTIHCFLMPIRDQSHCGSWTKNMGWTNPILQDHASQYIEPCQRYRCPLVSSHYERRLISWESWSTCFAQKLIRSSQKHMHISWCRTISRCHNHCPILLRKHGLFYCGQLMALTGNPRESRPLQWFAHEYIDRYHQMEQYHRLGIRTGIQKLKKPFDGAFKEYADLFLTKDANNAIRRGEVPKKRLFKDRTKFGNIVDEFEEKGLIRIHKPARYAMLSRVGHMGHSARHGECIS